MRPKILSLLAIPALALVGCSASEPAPAAAEKPSASATAASDNPASISDSQGSSAGDTTAEADFVAMVDSTVGKDAAKYPKSLRSKTNKSYWLKRGKALCKNAKPGEGLEVSNEYETAEEYRIETYIALAASTHLCPQG